MKLQEAIEGKTQTVNRVEAIGRISADFYSVYPPGIPILVPGEVITKEALGKVKEQTIRVVIEENQETT